MKRLYSKLIFFSLFIFFYQLHPEGFAAGTLVKVSYGYVEIESLHVGDRIVCLNDEKNLVESVITYVGKKSISEYVRVQFGDEGVGVACDQLFWGMENASWIDVSSFRGGDILISDDIDVYLLGVAQYHNFFVTKADICAHNFFPPIVVALSVAFGSGLVELAGISCGFAGLGAFLGYRWQKKDEERHKVVIEPQFYGGGMVPEDPDEEKKKKRKKEMKLAILFSH